MADVDWEEFGGLLAWDISDAIAKTVEHTGIDLGMDAIEPNLPAFIEACLATQKEIDKKEVDA
jgi:hypothetical protein